MPFFLLGLVTGVSKTQESKKEKQERKKKPIIEPKKTQTVQIKV